MLPIRSAFPSRKRCRIIRSGDAGARNERDERPVLRQPRLVSFHVVGRPERVSVTRALFHVVAPPLAEQ